MKSKLCVSMLTLIHCLFHQIFELLNAMSVSQAYRTEPLNSDVFQLAQQTLGQCGKSIGFAIENTLQAAIEVQNAIGYIPVEAQDELKRLFHCSTTHIRSLIEFYSFLTEQKRGQYVILFADNIIEEHQGSRALAQTLCDLLQCRLNESRVDGHVFVGFTSCIGMSDQGPSALVNGQPLPNLNANKIQQLAALIQQHIPVTNWPVEWFKVSNKIYQKDALLNYVLKPGQGIQTAIKLGATNSLQELEKSGLLGRGGAGFKTASKWRACQNAEESHKYIVCNADEGEPGTFKDRVLLTYYVEHLLEGMTICARIVGASKGFIYLRGEYSYLKSSIQRAIDNRVQQKLLGNGILGQSNFKFDIVIRMGAGAYICGEESALLESLEGKRGIPRIRPPFPATHGYLGYPTVVNNVETFAWAAIIIREGANYFQRQRPGAAAGTKLHSVSGDVEKPGIYEFPLGVTVKEMLDASGARRPFAVQIGGPSGDLLCADEFDRPIDFIHLRSGGSFMVFSTERQISNVVQNFTAFFAHESCGFCTPCRVGCAQMNSTFSRVIEHGSNPRDLERLHELTRTTSHAGHCGLGQTAGNPIRDWLAKFPDEIKQTRQEQAVLHFPTEKNSDTTKIEQKV